MNSIILKPRIQQATDRAASSKDGTRERIASPKTIAGKVIALTGASSGIGATTARLLAERGAHVVLGARRAARLEGLMDEIAAADGTARFKLVDVSQRAEMQAFIDYAVVEFGRLDVVVNNAGIMPLSPLSALQLDNWDRMIDVNLRGVLHGIAAALPVMQAQGSGQIINLTTIGAPVVPAGAAVYEATKAAVRAVSQGLRQESEQIRVTLISPGATATELADHIDDPATRCETRAHRNLAISAEAVARAILFAIEQPAEVDVSEIVIRPTANPF